MTKNEIRALTEPRQRARLLGAMLRYQRKNPARKEVSEIQYEFGRHYPDRELKELAEFLFVTYSSLQRFESGQWEPGQGPPFTVLEALYRDRFLLINGEPAGADEIMDVLTGQYIPREFYSLPEDVQEKVLTGRK